MTKKILPALALIPLVIYPTFLMRLQVLRVNH